MILTRRNAIAATIAAALAASSAAALPAAAQSTNLRVHTANPGSSAFSFTTTFQTVAQRELPVRMNVTSGMTSTRSTLDAARGDVGADERDLGHDLDPINAGRGAGRR